MDKGWVKLWRKALDNPWLQDANGRAIFFTLLLRASHEAGPISFRGRIFHMREGECIISQLALGNELCLTRMEVRTALERLKNGQLISQRVNQRLTLISITNWGTYQRHVADDSQPHNQSSNHSTTNRTRRVRREKNLNPTLKPESMNQTLSPGTNIVASEVPRQRCELPSHSAFEDFWQAYPKRPTDTKAAASKAWAKAIARGADPTDLQVAAKRYASFCQRTDHPSALVSTWVNREGWTASYEGNAGNGKPSIVERLAARLRAEGESLFGPDGPMVESRSPLWRRH